jgi:hypothetical protein
VVHPFNTTRCVRYFCRTSFVRKITITDFGAVSILQDRAIFEKSEFSKFRITLYAVLVLGPYFCMGPFKTNFYDVKKKETSNSTKYVL